MRRLHYQRVDVFTNRPFGGNPLAVFTNGRGLATETMQAIAREMNLSESSFVLPPNDPAHAYRVRIFTPGSELPMAGHPTVGTSYVLAREHMIEQTRDRVMLILEEGVGDIPVEINFADGSAGMIWMTQPAPQFAARTNDVHTVAGMLSLPTSAIDTRYPMEVVSTGVPVFFVPLVSLDAARSVSINRRAIGHFLPAFGTTEVFVFTTEVENPGSTVHSRMFAPELGVFEDPATGAASGPLGAYLVRYGIVPASPVAYIVSEQGIEMGRPSFIHIQIERRGDEIVRVQVGGECVYVGEGFIEVE
jgi:trans-2,3-dihydro-3-hydroxyanthranilate isomerase